MKSRLTLYQKGMVIIAIPLVLQLVVFLFYARLLDQAEFLASEEFRAKNVIGRCNWISTLIPVTALGCVSYAVSGDTQCLNFYNSGKDKLPRALKDGLDVFADNPGQAKRINRCKDLVGKLMAILEGSVNAPRPAAQARLLENKSEIYSIWTELFELRHDILREENSSYQINDESLPNTRIQQKLLIIAGCILDVFIACALFYLFSRGITMRLAVLSDNAVRFATRKQLHAPLSGQKDEVEELDHTFHAMAEAIAVAEQQKRDFVNMISHDLRTPLSAVQGTLELVTQRVCDPASEQGQQMLQGAERSVKTVLNLVNELLEMERIEAGMLTLERSDYAVADLISESVDMVQTIADQRKVTINRPASELRAYMDKERLVRVMVNLLGNALKFSPANSTITIGLVVSQDWFEVMVKDQGPGIPASYIDKVFDRFQQVGEDRRGSGLGLAICKAIVAEHGGTLGVTSTEGQGSTFWFRIPNKMTLVGSPEQYKLSV